MIRFDNEIKMQITFKEIKMKKLLSNTGIKLSAAVTVGLMAGADAAHANDFGNIAQNINTSIEDLPGLLTGLSYMIGILLGVLGILKIKDHVENPSQTPLQHGAIRLAAGGGLFALPIVFEAMQNTVGTGTTPTSATLNKVQFNVN